MKAFQRLKFPSVNMRKLLLLRFLLLSVLNLVPEPFNKQ